MSRRLVVIDHSFHQKTKSSDFFVEVLAKRYEIARLWDDAWKDGPHVTAEQIAAENADVVFYWQSLGPFAELRKLNRPFFWAPMYDEVVYRTPAFWRRLRTLPVSVISFSSSLAGQLEELGFRVMRVQYYPIPAAIPAPDAQRKLLIWQRTNIGLGVAQKLVGDQKLDRAVLKIDPDPGFEEEPIPDPTVGGVKVEVVRGFLEKAAYDDLVNGSTIYLAPRKFEGIGMAFLEAMARGAAVLAPDRPTMNEYIVHGQNGYLFDPVRPSRIDLSDLDRVRKDALRSVAAGRQKWQDSQEGILDFLESSDVTVKPLSSAADRLLAVFHQFQRVPIWVRNKRF